MAKHLHKCDVKPLSTNEAYIGRKRKTGKYRTYEIILPRALPPKEKINLPDEGPIGLIIRAGFSNRQSDIDNCIKPFVDILQKVYEFNDNRIYRLEVTKVKVPKGEEYIAFDVFGLDEEPTDDPGLLG